MQKPGKIVIASQHYPPDRSTTAAIMSAIAGHLAMDAPVLVLSGTPGSKHEPVSSGEPTIVEIKNRLPGKSALIRRAIAEILFVLRTFLALLMKLRRGDVALTVTAPFTLPYAVVAAAKLKRARSALIMHDLFPDVLVMAGLLKPKSIVAHAIRAANALMFRALDAVVTIGRDTEQMLLRYRGVTREKIWFIPNWATLAPAVRPIQPDNRYSPTRRALRGRPFRQSRFYPRSRHRVRGRTIAAARREYSFPALGLGNRLRAAEAVAIRSKSSKRHLGRARRGQKSRSVSVGRERMADSLSQERRRRIGPQPVLQPTCGWTACHHYFRARCRGRVDRKGTPVGLGRCARQVRRTCKSH